jgi:hypothetical protein
LPLEAGKGEGITTGAGEVWGAGIVRATVSFFGALEQETMKRGSNKRAYFIDHLSLEWVFRLFRMSSVVLAPIASGLAAIMILRLGKANGRFSGSLRSPASSS